MKIERVKRFLSELWDLIIAIPMIFLIAPLISNLIERFCDRGSHWIEVDRYNRHLEPIERHCRLCRQRERFDEFSGIWRHVS